jgi:hypothetical protein
MRAERVPRYDAEISIRRAHDVRKLAQCDICHGILDIHHSVLKGAGRKKVFFHGRCFIAQWGMDKFLQLDEPTLNSLTMGDIGVEAMTALVQRTA